MRPAENLLQGCMCQWMQVDGQKESSRKKRFNASRYVKWVCERWEMDGSGREHEEHTDTLSNDHLRWGGIKTILKGPQSRHNVIIEWVGMIKKGLSYWGGNHKECHIWTCCRWVGLFAYYLMFVQRVCQRWEWHELFGSLYIQGVGTQCIWQLIRGNMSAWAAEILFLRLSRCVIKTLLSSSFPTITALLSLCVERLSAEVLHCSTVALSQTLQHLTNTHLLTLAFICCLRIISPAASSSKSRLILCLLVCLYLHIHLFLTSSFFLIHFHPHSLSFASESGCCHSLSSFDLLHLSFSNGRNITFEHAEP